MYTYIRYCMYFVVLNGITMIFVCMHIFRYILGYWKGVRITYIFKYVILYVYWRVSYTIHIYIYIYIYIYMIYPHPFYV
jgi:hypothetical protein